MQNCFRMFLFIRSLTCWGPSSLASFNSLRMNCFQSSNIFTREQMKSECSTVHFTLQMWTGKTELENNDTLTFSPGELILSLTKTFVAINTFVKTNVHLLRRVFDHELPNRKFCFWLTPECCHSILRISSSKCQSGHWLVGQIHPTSEIPLKNVVKGNWRSNLVDHQEAIGTEESGQVDCLY